MGLLTVTAWAVLTATSTLRPSSAFTAWQHLNALNAQGGDGVIEVPTVVFGPALNFDVATVDVDFAPVVAPLSIDLQVADIDQGATDTALDIGPSGGDLDL